MTEEQNTRRLEQALYALIAAELDGVPYGAAICDCARKFDVTMSELNKAFDEYLEDRLTF